MRARECHRQWIDLCGVKRRTAQYCHWHFAVRSQVYDVWKLTRLDVDADLKLVVDYGKVVKA